MDLGGVVCAVVDDKILLTAYFRGKCKITVTRIVNAIHRIGSTCAGKTQDHDVPNAITLGPVDTHGVRANLRECDIGDLHIGVGSSDKR